MSKIDKVLSKAYKHIAPLFLMVSGFWVLMIGFFAYPLMLEWEQIMEFGEGVSQAIATFSLFWFMTWGVWFMYKGVETAKKFGSSPNQTPKE